MRTALSFLLAFVLLFGALPFVAFADASEDGWSVPESPEVTQELQAIFDQAMEGFAGVAYLPLALVGEKIAEDTFYRYLCQPTAVTPGAEPSFALVTICRDEQGNAKIENIETLETKSNSEKAAFSDNTLENGGVQITIPEEYMDLLVIEMPKDDPGGVLFTVSEKASIEAEKARGHENTEGAGWLFTIVRVDEEELHDILCYYMTGQKLFAKDTEGYYYIYKSPTDVRFVRESYEGIAEGTNEDWKLWGRLNVWADTVPAAMIAENPGLTEEKRGNTELDIMLSHVAYRDDTLYTISTTEFGPLSPEGTDAAPYLEKLMAGVKYEFLRNAEAPDGEYVVLEFPETQRRFDFFLMEGEKNVIRYLNGGGFESFYLATFDDGETKASDVMLDWYHALARQNGLLPE